MMPISIAEWLVVTGELYRHATSLRDWIGSVTCVKGGRNSQMRSVSIRTAERRVGARSLIMAITR